MIDDLAGNGPRAPAETGGDERRCLRGTLPFQSRFREGPASALGLPQRACKQTGGQPLRDRFVADAAVDASARARRIHDSGCWLLPRALKTFKF